MAISWTNEQRAAIENRGGTLLISAAAGSGKTAVLVERLLRRITDEHLDVTQFLMITYTNAAAAELRAKILDALHERIAAQPFDRHLTRQLTLVHSAKIST
ncbi:MAG: UvrD-helicase domain-containing protein, partial [Clostridia bacterium]